MIEASYWSAKVRPALIKTCQRLGFRHHFERVENGVADGTPDVDYLIESVAGKLELKYTDSNPKQELTPVLGKGRGLRRSQIIYASRYSWAGGLIWCLVGTPKESWLIDLRGKTPEEMDYIALMNTIQLRKASTWHNLNEQGDTLPLALLEKGYPAALLRAGKRKIENDES